MQIMNNFFGDKKLNREGCTAVRPQNTNLLTFFGKIRQPRIRQDQPEDQEGNGCGLPEALRCRRAKERTVEVQH